MAYVRYVGCQRSIYSSSQFFTHALFTEILDIHYIRLQSRVCTHLWFVGCTRLYHAPLVLPGPLHKHIALLRLTMSLEQ